MCRLPHMLEFRGQDVFPLDYLCRMVPTANHSYFPRRISQRIHRPCRLSRPLISMHSHPTKIMPKSWLHKGACTLIERLASATTQHLVDERRGAGRFPYGGGPRLFTCKKIIWTPPRT